MTVMAHGRTSAKATPRPHTASLPLHTSHSFTHHESHPIYLRWRIAAPLQKATPLPHTASLPLHTSHIFTHHDSHPYKIPVLVECPQASDTDRTSKTAEKGSGTNTDSQESGCKSALAMQSSKQMIGHQGNRMQETGCPGKHRDTMTMQATPGCEGRSSTSLSDGRISLVETGNRKQLRYL